jgi:hypothetical protein
MSDDELETEQANLVDLVDDFETDEEPVHEKKVQLTIVMKHGETVDQAKARAALSPEYHAAESIFQLGQILSTRDVDLTKLAERLEYQSQELSKGDLGQAESMLAAHAYTLNALFHNLLRRSALNWENDFSVIEKLIKLAMKAQSQCRTTLDTLASMKKPPPELIRQTNIAHGHQQVNNFPENRDGENELLEEKDGERLDTGTPPEAVRVDPDLATVDEQHRTTNGRRQD